MQGPPPPSADPIEPSPPAGRAWYVFVAKPQQENHAANKLLEQGYEVFLPLFTQWAKTAGGWRMKQTVMFPRYGFVRPAHAEQAIGPARSTPGVSHLVKFGYVLGCVSADRVNALREIVAQRAEHAPTQPLEPGKQVIFSSGPLKGLSGIVSSSSAERVVVLMTLLGSERQVAVRTQDLSLA